MKLIYKGKYDKDSTILPHGEHMPNAVKVKEIEDIDKLALIMNVVSVVITILLLLLVKVRGEVKIFEVMDGWVVIPIILMLLLHELLHAIFFKKEVYLYYNLRQCMLLVIGTETMSKVKSVMMAAFPNIILGFIPYIIFLINPECSIWVSWVPLLLALEL